MTFVFYLSAAVAIYATIMVITRVNAVHALLYMIVSLFSVALIFYTLGAPFMAALEVIIYAGAIMVLFIFVVMMLNLGKQSADQERQLLSAKSWIIPVVLALILIAEFIFLVTSGNVHALAGTSVEPQTVGKSMYTSYMLGVELAGLLLLAGLVGAFHLGKKQPPSQSSEDEE